MRCAGARGGCGRLVNLSECAGLPAKRNGMLEAVRSLVCVCVCARARACVGTLVYFVCVWGSALFNAGGGSGTSSP